MIERPGNADTLSLPSRQPHAPVTHNRVKAMRQTVNKFPKLRFLHSLPHRFLVNLLLPYSESDIIAYRIVGKIDGLGNVPHLGMKGLGLLMDINIIRHHHALYRRQKPQYNIHHGGFP